MSCHAIHRRTSFTCLAGNSFMQHKHLAHTAYPPLSPQFQKLLLQLVDKLALPSPARFCQAAVDRL